MKYSLLIGRYQPLHVGHITLIRTVLNEGKNVCVALRAQTEENINENPYSFEERAEMFYKEFKEEMDSLKLVITLIPDIEEVAYGRKVGWGIREIKLDKATEEISGTQIRKELDIQDN